MSRSGYIEDYEDMLVYGRWRAQVMSAIRGKRGQKCLADLLKALDEMPDKALITAELQDEAGDVCALGALGKARGIDMERLDPDEPEDVAAAFDIAPQLASEIVYMNDEWDRRETPGERWQRMRLWVASNLREMK